MSKRKGPSNENNPNHEFCEFLLEIGEYERTVNRNIHKYNAYRKAASSLAVHDTKIKSGEEARKLDGVGKKIAEKIDEFLHTGKLRKIDKIREDDDSQAITLLTQVSGIGPAKAQDLVRSGIKSIEDLEKNKGKLNHHQLIGLKYFEDFKKKIPREEIEKIEKIINKNINDLDIEYMITICGSYRRGKSESGDIDVLITHPHFTSKTGEKGLSAKYLKKIVTKLEETLIVDTISLGDVKFMGVCKISEIALRLDIRLTPHDQYHCATLYFTGSDMFNKEMRAHALHNGFTLNEYCLRRLGETGVPGESVPISSEKDVFEYINYPYKSPQERDI